MSDIDFYRTPDDHFEGLKDYDYEPKYVEDLPGFEGLRMHYVDEGPEDAPVYLCLHGEPTWAYLYRKMIPIFLEDGGRVVCPDYFGFGRSDKPVDDEIYTFEFHRNSLWRFIDATDLQRVTLVCQDWGGLAGLTLPMEMPERFERLLVMNTALATGEPPSAGFVAWREYVRSEPDLDVGRLIDRAVPGGIDDTAQMAYDAPFDGEVSKAGVRSFPEIVPTEPDAPGAEVSRRAARWFREVWEGPSFMAIGMQDPVLGPDVMHRLRDVIPGCPEPLELEDAGHFVQESGDVVARAALDYWKTKPGVR